MIRRSLPYVAAALAAFVLVFAAFEVGCARAADVPQSSARDHRVKRVAYSADDVVEVVARAGRITRIVLEPGETILKAGTGFPEGWSLESAGHILYVRAVTVGSGEGAIAPRAREWSTNLVITTTARLYDLALRLVEEGAVDTDAAHRVEFLYPERAREAAAREEDEEGELEERERALERLPVPRNARYTGKGSREILPSLAFDDGRFTYLRFAANAEMPAVFAIGADGAETVVNTHIDPARADFLVVNRLARQLVLRLGDAVASVFNEGYDAAGVAPENGTTVPGLARSDAPDWSAFDRAQGVRR